MRGIVLNLVVLHSSDLQRAAAFYACLGLHFEKHQHGTGAEHFAAELGGAVFELYPIEGNHGSTTATRIGFAVPSVDNCLAKLKDYPEAIVLPAKDSPWGRRAVLKDPDGHKVELIQRN